MKDAETCRACGTDVPADAPFGHCPRCLLEHGFLYSNDSGFDLREAPSKNHRFGDYELLERIGRGGMGVVFKARQISLNRIVALKMLPDFHLGSPGLLQRFQVEAENVAQLAHPNIVPIYEVGEHDDQHFFCMRLIEGEGLDQRIARGAFRFCSEKRSEVRPAQMKIATLIATVARAVHHAHEQGVLHRDIKPSNILLDQQGQPHLTDFGVSKRLGVDLTITKQGDVIGTPNYMAPEQAAGTRVTIAADVYSLGAILYELLAGHPPFEAATPMETLRLVVEREPRRPTVFNEAIDKELETICLKCIEKDPVRRYSSAEALAQDLERWQHHQPIHARPAGPVRRTTRWIRRNPLAAALILTLFLGLGASLASLKAVMDQRRATERVQGLADRARQIILDQIGISGFWDRPDASARIPAEVLSVVIGAEEIPKLGKANIQRYSVGMVVEEDPVETVMDSAPLLGYLEAKLSPAHSNAVRFEIILFKRNRHAISALAAGQVDILKIGGNSYLKARQLDSGVQVLVAQEPAKRGVIFVRGDSGITHLNQIAGRSVVFGDTESTISTWGAYYLAEAGVTRTNLRHFQFIDSVSAFEMNPPRRATRPKLNGHVLAMEGVLTNGFAAGVATEKQFLAVGATAGFKALKSFDSDPVYWVARADLPTDIAAQLSQALVALKDAKLLKTFSKKMTGFAPAFEHELEPLRKAMLVVEANFGVQDEKQ